MCKNRKWSYSKFRIAKLFLSWVPMNILKDWKAKLESGYSFMLNYSKITACTMSMYVFLNKKGRKKKSQV